MCEESFKTQLVFSLGETITNNNGTVAGYDQEIEGRRGGEDEEEIGRLLLHIKRLGNFRGKIDIPGVLSHV